MHTPRSYHIVVSVDSGAKQTKVPQWVHDKLRQHYPEHIFTIGDTSEDILPDLPEADIYLGWKVDQELLDAGKRLQWIHTPRIGIESFYHGIPLKAHCPITYGESTFAIPMAEHILGLMIALCRKFQKTYQLQLQKKWDAISLCLDFPPLIELSQKTLAIIGVGAIGREVAKRAKAFDMRVIGTNKSGNAVQYVDEIHLAEQFETIIQEGDFVLITAAHTTETHRMFSDRQFQMMKPTAYFMNVARGKIVDEEALIRALREKNIAGGGLDVFEKEPLPEESPLWHMDQVIITPHCCGFTDQFWVRILELFEENFNRFINGEPLKRLYDPQRGY